MNVKDKAPLNRLDSIYKRMGINPEDQQRRIKIRTLIEEKCEKVKKLPAPQKLLFLLHFSYGHSLAEIGELCGLSEGQVRRRLQKTGKEVDTFEKGDA
jgi:RNA polymerase sigma factor (sigma-70 family)